MRKLANRLVRDRVFQLSATIYREEIQFINSWLREKVKGGLVTGPGTGSAWLCCALLRYSLTGRVSGPAICPVLRSRASHAPPQDAADFLSG